MGGGSDFFDRRFLPGLTVEPREGERLLLSNVGVAMERNLSLRDFGVAGDGLRRVEGVCFGRLGDSDLGGLKSKSMKVPFLFSEVYR